MAGHTQPGKARLLQDAESKLREASRRCLRGLRQNNQRSRAREDIASESKTGRLDLDGRQKAIEISCSREGGVPWARDASQVEQTGGIAFGADRQLHAAPGEQTLQNETGG